MGHKGPLSLCEAWHTTSSVQAVCNWCRRPHDGRTLNTCASGWDVRGWDKAISDELGILYFNRAQRVHDRRTLPEQIVSWSQASQTQLILWFGRNWIRLYGEKLSGFPFDVLRLLRVVQFNNSGIMFVFVLKAAFGFAFYMRVCFWGTTHHRAHAGYLRVCLCVRERATGIPFGRRSHRK